MSDQTIPIKQIVFIDSAVPDSDAIIAGLPPDSAYYFLDDTHDGLQQMADILSSYSGLDAIHVISHGSVGSLQLGDGFVTQDTLDSHSAALTTIGQSLTEAGDLLLYGCDVAQGDVGQAFLKQLAIATGADVAASTDLTGAVILGGNWVLESTVGDVASGGIDHPFSYNQILASAIPIRLPFDSHGTAIVVSQEPGATFSHIGPLYTSWDFVLSYGDQVLAVAYGTVIDIRETVPDGETTALPNSDGDKNELNDDPSLGSGGIGNIVTIRHVVNGQTFYGTYMHLQNSSVPVSVGDIVHTGQVIGEVGNTGSREGTHLHFQVGSTAIQFGATNYGGGTGDNATPQTISNATQSEVGLVSFENYGTDLPATVIGPPVDGQANDIVRQGIGTGTQLFSEIPLHGAINAEPMSGDIGISVSDGGLGKVDKDWYQVTLDKGITYTFGGSSTSITTGLMDISLYSLTGIKVHSAVEGANPSFTFDTTYQSSATQTYYLAVSAGGTDPAWKTATGDYVVTLSGENSTTLDQIPESILSTETLAPGVKFGTIDSADISGGPDDDYYKVTLNGGDKYRFIGSAGVSANDTLDSIFIRLHDANGGIPSTDGMDSPSL